MKRLLLIGFATCVLALTPTLSASAMPLAKHQTVITGMGSDVIQVKGHRGGKGHHYGWSRGRRGHR